jgi:hypothetical protein
MDKTYAIIKDSIVENIIVVNTDLNTIEEIKNIYNVDEVVELNLNEVANLHHFCIGASYVDNKFKRPKPYASFVFDEYINDWIAPVERPNPEVSEEGDVIFPVWDEETLSWIFQ